MIVLSVLEAVRCPDKPGFELGFGYSQYANELTIDCYLQMLNQFRSVNLSDSVEQLVFQTQYFNLNGLNSITLFNQNLTGNEMVSILESAEESGAKLTELYVYDYFTDSDMQVLARYLNTSKLAIVQLGSLDPIYGGGEGLSAEGLQYLIQVLPFIQQLTYLWLDFPQVNDSGITALAGILHATHINRLCVYMDLLTDVGGISIAQAVADMPMQQLGLSGLQLGNGTVQALANMLYNSRTNLTQLWIEGDRISNTGVQFFAHIIQNSLIDTLALLSMNMTDEGLTAVANSLVYLPLQALVIGSSSGEIGIVNLINQLNKTNIGHLELMYNSFTNNSMQALADTLPSTVITHLDLILNNLNSVLATQLAPGLANSAVNHLVIWANNLSDSFTVLGPNLANIKILSINNASITNADLITLIPFLTSPAMQELELSYNQLNDTSIVALAAVLPQTRINGLYLFNNSVTDIGATALANVYSYSALQVLDLIGNNISADILYEVENYQWQQYCQNLLCHANAPYKSDTGSSQSQQKPGKNFLHQLKKLSLWPNAL